MAVHGVADVDGRVIQKKQLRKKIIKPLLRNHIFFKDGSLVWEKQPVPIISNNFLTKNHAIFESAKHSDWNKNKVKLICKTCDKFKYVNPSVIKNGKHHFCSKKCVGIWLIKNMKKKDTSIELAIEQELINRNISYSKQVSIEGISLVDFILPNKIIIQCDGNYWHSRKINKGRDIAQDVALHFKGYKVFRFTETEIKKSTKKCIDRIFR